MIVEYLWIKIRLVIALKQVLLFFLSCLFRVMCYIQYEKIQQTKACVCLAKNRFAYIDKMTPYCTLDRNSSSMRYGVKLFLNVYFLNSVRGHHKGYLHTLKNFLWPEIKLLRRHCSAGVMQNYMLHREQFSTRSFLPCAAVNGDCTILTLL